MGETLRRRRSKTLTDFCSKRSLVPSTSGQGAAQEALRAAIGNVKGAERKGTASTALVGTRGSPCSLLLDAFQLLFPPHDSIPNQVAGVLSCKGTRVHMIAVNWWSWRWWGTRPLLGLRGLLPSKIARARGCRDTLEEHYG